MPLFVCLNECLFSVSFIYFPSILFLFSSFFLWHPLPALLFFFYVAEEQLSRAGSKVGQPSRLESLQKSNTELIVLWHTHSLYMHTSHMVTSIHIHLKGRPKESRGKPNLHYAGFIEISVKYDIRSQKSLDCWLYLCCIFRRTFLYTFWEKVMGLFCCFAS